MIRCISFRAYQKNTLKGFGDLEFTRAGLVIRDCTWHEKNGRQWVSFPARLYTDKDGSTQWQPLIEFAEGAAQAREKFRELAVAAIHAVADEQSRESVS